ncbi:hypothetical protein TWF679_010550 [Orbilia oligospora]|uniref:Uncharacterized protein n=1 Tax=Orbilia oligospora TaxID=2813651 RepID=A0A8H8V099_ORBOL|nr:hypothetical protein TWF679_010550 [Orbilia oligospora]
MVGNDRGGSQEAQVGSEASPSGLATDDVTKEKMLEEEEGGRGGGGGSGTSGSGSGSGRGNRGDGGGGGGGGGGGASVASDGDGDDDDDGGDGVVLLELFGYRVLLAGQHPRSWSIRSSPIHDE